MDGSYILEHAVHAYIEPVEKENTGLAVQENVEYEHSLVSRGGTPTSVHDECWYILLD